MCRQAHNSRLLLDRLRPRGVRDSVDESVSEEVKAIKMVLSELYVPASVARSQFVTRATSGIRNVR